MVPSDIDMIVSNIGVYPDLSAIYTTNASMNTAFVQVSLKEDHSIASYVYMHRVQEKLSREMPELITYFQAGGLVDGVVNQGYRPRSIFKSVRSIWMGLTRSPGTWLRRSKRCLM